MKRIITQEHQAFINQLKNDLLIEFENQKNKDFNKSTISNLLNFSKSLKIIPSSSVKGLDFEMISN